MKYVEVNGYQDGQGWPDLRAAMLRTLTADLLDHLEELMLVWAVDPES